MQLFGKPFSWTRNSSRGSWPSIEQTGTPTRRDMCGMRTVKLTRVPSATSDDGTSCLPYVSIDAADPFEGPTVFGR